MHGIRASVVTTVVYEMSQRGNRIVCIAKLLSNTWWAQAIIFLKMVKLKFNIKMQSDHTEW